jgi:stage II sporulation protein D
MSVLLSLFAAAAGAAAAGAAPAGPPPAPLVEPAALPSGMDLLYGDRVFFAPNGEPIITIGLASGRERVALRAGGPVQVDFYEDGVLKQASVRPGGSIDISLRRATPAARTYAVDLEGVPFGDKAALERTTSGWRARGEASVAAMEEGVVLGMAGRVLDNRDYRLLLPAPSAAEAERKVGQLFDKFGTLASVRARLRERPWGELGLAADGAPLGKATSYVRLHSASGLLQVNQVEYGKGYSWHGFEDRSYRGEIYVVVDPSGHLAVVNVLGLEAVLEGVVPAEMQASAPPEALKAQAVAARSHILSKLGRRHHDDPFQLCAEQHCQVYAGIGREDSRASAAVRATYGEALFFKSTLVDTVYSSSCGGYSEDNDAVWGDAPNPALRAQPDFDAELHPELAAFADGPAAAMEAWVAAQPEAYCAKASKARADKFRWSRTFGAAELDKLLDKDYGHLGHLRDLQVEARGAGGRVISLRLVGARGSASVLHELPIRQLFGNLNSGAFVIDIKRDSAGSITEATFHGAGWGHGVGMCQVGAVGRAEAGQSYQQILAHYYNGAQIEHLYPPPPAGGAALAAPR